MPSQHLQQDVTRYADLIEAEMRRIGFWQSRPLQPEQMKFTQAFAMDTMAYTQWLQFIFLTRVREAAASNQFPSSSSVGAQAVREFDGNPDADALVTLLAEFDALFD
ncbi:MAG TPA: YqcC family protein [Candidatus Angelobacter sp.]